jgi:hypothetical protein
MTPESPQNEPAPTGLPNESEEETPLGPQVTNPDDPEVPDEGPGAQPGIPTDGEPPASA